MSAATDKTRHKAIVDLATVRRLIADYMRSEGCSCCRNQEEHDATKEKLAKLLRVPRWSDGSGRDFGRFKTKRGTR